MRCAPLVLALLLAAGSSALTVGALSYGIADRLAAGVPLTLLGGGIGLLVVNAAFTVLALYGAVANAARDTGT